MPNCLAMRTVVVCALAVADRDASVAAATMQAVQKCELSRVKISSTGMFVGPLIRSCGIARWRQARHGVSRAAEPVDLFPQRADLADFMRREGFRWEEIG